MSGAGVIASVWHHLEIALFGHGKPEDLHYLASPLSQEMHSDFIKLLMSNHPKAIQEGPYNLYLDLVAVKDVFGVAIDFRCLSRQSGLGSLVTAKELIRLGNYSEVDADLTEEYFYDLAGKYERPEPSAVEIVGVASVPCHRDHNSIHKHFMRRGLRECGLLKLLAFGAMNRDPFHQTKVMARGGSGQKKLLPKNSLVEPFSHPCIVPDGKGGRRLEIVYSHPAEEYDEDVRYLVEPNT